MRPTVAAMLDFGRRAAAAAAAIGCIALAAAEPAQGADGWQWPVRGQVLTRYVNGSDPYAAGQHRGIDIGAPVGTPVVAAADGRVMFAGTAGSSGLTVGVATTDGRYETSYLHLSSTAVHRGDAVHSGERIGAVGTSGRRSAEAPHLHFGVRDAGTDHGYHDPLAFLPSPPPVDEPARPPASPAPVGEPATPTAAPAPVRVPHAERSPKRARPPRRVRVPDGRRAPRQAPRGMPGPSRRPGLHGAPSGIAAEVPARASHPQDAGRNHGHDPASGTLLGAAPGGKPIANPDTPKAPSRGASSPSVGRPRGAFDLGWLAACLGCIAAAFALGRPDASRAAAARGRSAIASALRPLTGKG